MIEFYRPNNIISANEQIKKVHDKTNGELEVGMSESELKKLVYRIVSMETIEILGYSYTLSSNEIYSLAIYIFTNQYKVDIKNIVQAVSYRMSERVLRQVFLGFKNVYSKIDIVGLFATIIQSARLTEQFAKITSIDPKKLSASIMEGKPAEFVFDFLYDDSTFTFDDFVDSMKNNSIASNRQLGIKLIEMFYYMCKKEEYLRIGENALLNIIQNAGSSIQFLILINMLKTLSDQELRGFVRVIAFYYLRTGDYGLPRFDAYFRDTNEELILKYRSWLNHYNLVRAFSNDFNQDRVKFWSRYENRCSMSIIPHIESMIMDFGNFVVVEFEIMGPIYWFDKKYYNSTVKMHIAGSNNQEFRSWLYNMSDYHHRKIHNGVWTWEASTTTDRLLR